MLQGESTVTLVKMAAMLALLVFGLRLSAPVPHETAPVPIAKPVSQQDQTP